VGQGVRQATPEGVMQGRHDMKRKGDNYFTEALQASLLSFTKGISPWQFGFSKVSILERISSRFLSRCSRRSLPLGLCAGGSIPIQLLHSDIDIGSQKKGKDSIDAYCVDSREYCRTVNKESDISRVSISTMKLHL
jgi:hypothetical protein